MAIAELNQVRLNLVEMLLERVQEDRYPSATMLDMIEAHLELEDVPAYLQTLLERVEAQPYPSIDMLNRIQRFL